MDYKQIISDLDLINRIFRIIVISFSTLGIVYMAGRLLEIFKKPRCKNILAVILLFAHSYIISIIKFPQPDLIQTAWDTWVYASFGAILYISLCWDWYNFAQNIKKKFIRKK